MIVADSTLGGEAPAPFITDGTASPVHHGPDQETPSLPADNLPSEEPSPLTQAASDEEAAPDQQKPAEPDALENHDPSPKSQASQVIESPTQAATRRAVSPSSSTSSRSFQLPASRSQRDAMVARFLSGEDALSAAESVHKIPGTTWLAKHGGQLWPVVLCNDETIPLGLLRAAKKPEWKAAFILGCRTYVWVTDKNLRQYDSGTDYFKETHQRLNESYQVPRDVKDATNQRWKAFKQDLPLTNRLPLDERCSYWWAQRQQVQGSKGGQEQALRKRKRHDDEEDDADSFASHSTQKKQKLEQATIGSTSTPEASGKNKQLRSPPPSSEPQANTGLGIRWAKQPSPLRTKRFDGSVWKQEQYGLPPTHGMCDIRAGGKGSQTHRVTREVLDRCKILSDHVRNKTVQGVQESVVDICSIPGVVVESNGRQLIDIIEYLQTHDFLPRLVGQSPTHRLSQTAGKEGMRDAAMHIAMVYRQAAQFELEGLQILCMKKLELIEQKLDSSAILGVGRLVVNAKGYSAPIGDKVYNWVLERVVRCYWHFMEHAGNMLGKLMTSNTAVREESLKLLAGDPNGLGCETWESDFERQEREDRTRKQ